MMIRKTVLVFVLAWGGGFLTCLGIALYIYYKKFMKIKKEIIDPVQSVIKGLNIIDVEEDISENTNK